MRKLLAIVAGGLTLLLLPTILFALMGDSGLSAVVSLIVGIAGAYFVGRAIWRGWEAPPSLRNNKVRIGWGILGALVLIMVVGNLATGGDKPSGGRASREGVVAKEQTPKPSTSAEGLFNRVPGR
jgi:hypothetical protein